MTVQINQLCPEVQNFNSNIITFTPISPNLYEYNQH